MMLIITFLFIFYFFFEMIQYVSLYLKTRNFKQMESEGRYDEVIASLEAFDPYERGGSQFLKIYVSALSEKNVNLLKNKKKIDHADAVKFLNFSSYVRNHDLGDKDLNDYHAFVAYSIFKDFFYEDLASLFDSNEKKPSAYFNDEWVQREFEEVFLDRKDYKRALLVNNRLLKKRPNDLYFQLQNAIILYEMGKVLESIEAFRGVVFTHDGYGEDMKDAMKWLIDVSKKYSLTENIDYYYEYILEKSNRDLFWLKEYKDYAKGKISTSRLVLLNKEIRLKERASGG